MTSPLELCEIFDDHLMPHDISDSNCEFKAEPCCTGKELPHMLLGSFDIRRAETRARQSDWCSSRTASKGSIFPNLKVPRTAGQGVENWRELFGLRSDKESLNSVLKLMPATIIETSANLVFGDNGPGCRGHGAAARWQSR